ncbi:MAG: asparagine--tRNA ligase [Bdellovibrionales bacterium]|nr:asparagine--tRNA ligase [Bdellovibrionales bacterium]
MDLCISKLNRHIGETVTLKGWVYNKRSSGKIKFLIFRDGTGIIQAVIVKGNVPESVLENFEKLTQETSLSITGLVKEDKRSPIGVELELSDLKVFHVAEEYPLGKKDHGIDFLLSKRHLWLRSKRPSAILRIRDSYIRAIRDFFFQEGFALVDSPIFTPNACEGTSTLFETEYFDQKAYLSQSGQLYAEAAAMALGKVYCFGPTFRAEKSKTRRHLTEFWMVEPEAAYFDLEDDMALAERFLEFTIQRVLKECAVELQTLERDTTKLQNVKAPFPKISYTEAVELLKAKGQSVQFGDDFGAPEETIIGESFDRPVFIHRYPAKIKAFYMKRDPQNPELALAMDCIAPEGYGEIIGGSQREDDYETLVKRLKEQGLPLEPFEWYLDLRRYGSVPHAGFGLGVERTLSWICGLDHLRETAAFPRMMYRLEP